MTTVVPHVYGLTLQSLVEGRINMVADPVWVMLVTSGYVFNQNSHKFKSVVNGELQGSGYTPGGQQVTISAPAYNSATKILSVPAGNVIWPAVTWTGATGAVLYMKPAGFPEDAMPLLAYGDFGGAVDRTAQAFYLNWASSGIFKMAVP